MVHPLGGMRGPARTLAQLAPAVAEAWEVQVVAPEGYLTSTLRAAHGVTVERLPAGKTRAVSWVRGSRYIMRLVRRDTPPDAIHANGLSALNLVAPTAIRCRIPVLVHFHHGARLGLRSRLLGKLWPRVGLDVRIAPVSQAALAVLKNAGLGRYSDPVLSNPVRVSEVERPRRSRRPLRVGYLGSPSPNKGLHLLVEIAERLAREDLEWLVFGIDPDDRSEYVRACRRRLSTAGLDARVVWGGKVRDPSSAYAKMDVLLVPSLQESWCRVAMEGMASGLPVVGTAIPGLSELLELVDGGLMFAPDRPDAASEQIRKLAGDARLRSILGQRGQRAVAKFDVELVSRDLLTRYDEMTKRPTPAGT